MRIHGQKKYIIESCQDIGVDVIQGNRRNRKQQSVTSRQLEVMDMTGRIWIWGHQGGRQFYNASSHQHFQHILIHSVEE